MFKFATTLFTIFSIVLVSTTAPTLAQPPAGSDAQPAATQNTNMASKPDLQQVFAKETEKLKAENSTFDPVKADIESSKQQAQKKGWSTTKKTLVITAIAVGLAAILFIAIKYHKDCLRSDPENCSPGIDENCVCLEYERRIPKGQ
jgi:hypothetical protein